MKQPVDKSLDRIAAPDNALQVYSVQEPFLLERGGRLAALSIAYQTWGTLNAAKNNVIWICHALTANANAQEWWPTLIGQGKCFDTQTHFVVCANILGSCYGTTGPNSINPETGTPYFHSFPALTIRDMVKAHVLLREHLDIQQIQLLAGGSMGGYQAIEWAVMEPTRIRQLFLIATSARESAWGIAIHATQRLAIETDSSWGKGSPTDGSNGLKVARGIGMLTYRSYQAFVHTQTDTDNAKVDHFRAASYIQYQGKKLANRFSAYSYWVLSKAMDTHNLSRGRSSLWEVLQSISARTLVIGITSDLLCPMEEARFMADAIPGATFIAIDSLYGHDGFLVETATISQHLSTWAFTRNGN